MIDRLSAVMLGSRRRAAVVVGIWVVLAAIVPAVAPKLANVEDNQTANDPPPAAESLQARALVQRAFPEDRGTPAIIVLRDPQGLSSLDLAEVRRMSDALSGSGRPDRVAGVVSISTVPGARDSLVSTDGTTTLIIVQIIGSPTDAAFNDTVDAVRKIAGQRQGTLQVRVTGPAGIIRDTLKVFGSANLVLLLGTVALVLALLLAIYRSPLLALIPVVTAGIAIEVTNGLGASLAKAGAFTVNSQAASIMTVLAFGVGTDYCLFVITRYRDEMSGGGDRLVAMHRAINGVGSAVLFSGATIVCALLVLLTATLPAVRGFGPFLALAVAVTTAVCLTFVPALVVLLGRAAFWPRADRPSRLAHTVWSRIADTVAARPAVVAALTLALLVGLASGLVSYRESYSFLTGFRVSTESLEGQSLLAAAFAPGQLAPTTVLVNGRGAWICDHPDAVADLVRSMSETPGVRSVSPSSPCAAESRANSRSALSADGTVGRLTVVYDDDPYGPVALDRTEHLRQVAARSLHASTLGGGAVLVGGDSATNLDLRTANHHDLGIVVPLTLLAIAIALVLVLRGLVAPLYLMVTVVLSLLATLGLTIFVLLDLGRDQGIGNRDTIYIFIFLVALGVDYNIFLMTRIREEVRQHGLRSGVQRGIVRSGGVISSAGVILAGTFAVLMTQPIRELYQFGFAMAIGILLDTFVIRGTLVPAIILLCGRWNWWPSRRSWLQTVPALHAAANSDQPARSARL